MAGRPLLGYAVAKVVAVTALLVFLPLAGGLPSASAADCPDNLCPATEEIHDMLADSDGDGKFDSSFHARRLNSLTVEIRLVTFGGDELWRFPMAYRKVLEGDELPAAGPTGDFTGDGVDDYAFAARAPIKPAPERCGPYEQTWSQLALVSGKAGKVSYPLPSVDNKCWDFSATTEPDAIYPTHRYVGFIQIGDVDPGRRGLEVISVPQYPADNRGRVLNFEHEGKWVARTLVHPSDPGFAEHYNAANPGKPCKFPFTLTRCDVENSHVPSGLITNSFGERGFFSMTSGRALFYRSDLTPTSDTVWNSGDTANGGRNKGFVLSYSHEGRDYVSLIGGCSVKVARAAMEDGRPPGGRLDTSLGGVDAHCGIHRHAEWFEIKGTRVLAHWNRYYSYSLSDGFFHRRVEYPANALGPIGGDGTPWLAYNLFEAPKGSTGEGEWRIEFLPNPAAPAHVRKLNGWFVWDLVDLDGDGKSEVLATRADNRDEPYLLPWEFDILSWDPERKTMFSRYHREGVAPGLYPYPNTATRFADGGRKREGTITRDLDGDGVKELMVEDEDGRRSYLRVGGFGP